MTEIPRSRSPRVSPEQRRAAAGQFDRANQVLAEGNYDYGIQLLLACCQLDAVNPIYRQSLRHAQKAKYHDNRRGQRLALLTTLPARLKQEAALKQGNMIRVLELGEKILCRNPWDLRASLVMAQAFEKLDAPSLAIWTLDQVRQLYPDNVTINRGMARLFEARGNFTQAMALWEIVRKAVPTDVEARHKAKDLAAHDTIARGKYENAVQGQGSVRLSGDGDDTASDTSALLQTSQDLIPLSSRANNEEENLRGRINANPTSPNVYLHLASYFRRHDRFDQARQVILQGMGPTGNHFDLSMELADLDIEPFRRDLELAEAKVHHDPADALLQRIKEKLEREIATRELDFFRQKADRFPTDNSFKYEVGVRLFKTGQYDEAIKQLQEIRGDPRHQGKALLYLGFCFKGRNNGRLAQRNFEEALKHLPAGDTSLRKEILYQLAVGNAEAGDYNRAVDLACELANVDFSYRDIGTLLDNWNAKLQSV